LSKDELTPAPDPNDARTRFIQLDGGQARHEGHDLSTMVGLGARVTPGQVPFEALFFAHYSAIRSICRGLADPGVAVIAVHVPTCRLAGRMWLRAHPGRPATAIVGRHRRADLLLRFDAGLSLRHLALVLHPLRSWDGHDARFSVIDLRTGSAFHDERGRQLEGVRCEGPALLSCGEYALFFLQTGDATDWPALAADAWSMLPRRIYLDERDAEPDRWQRRAAGQWIHRRERNEEHTLITAIRGPVRADDRLLRDGEQPLGALNLLTQHTARRVVVGPAAASSGILLGRYSRCDAADALSDYEISRTHLLLLRVENRMYAVDTASTHGSYVDRGARQHHEFRILALEGETCVVLGDERAALRWHPVQ